MSCRPGKPCWERFKRRRALQLLGLMAVIFLALSAFSFLDSRGQALPSEIHYAGFGAVQGKRVFQSYNCMGCHTIVGNGAYFGPDLTKLYGKVGPAWLEAFLPSAGGWPANGALRLKLQEGAIALEAGTESVDEYLEKYPGAAERIARRGGHPTLMPNLPLTRDEIGQLIAFLKYTSAMNTEGWPPVPAADGMAFKQASAAGGTRRTPSWDAQGGESAPQTLSQVDQGAELARQSGCTACHAIDGKQLVGPGWGDLFGSRVALVDGSTVMVDDTYLTESIVDPNAKVVKGFVSGSMPSFAQLLDTNQVAAIVAYIRSLRGK